MITAIVLINVEKTKINSAATILAGIDGISEVYSVTGRFDLVVMIRLSTNEELAELMTTKISNVDGIIKTESMIALKTLSVFDIANMFDLGN